MFKIAPPDTNNAGIEDETSLSASKTTFELYNDMDEQEECVENVQLSDQDDEDEEKSLCDEGNDLLYFSRVVLSICLELDSEAF